MQKYTEIYIVSKMGMSEMSRNVDVSDMKAPAGAS